MYWQMIVYQFVIGGKFARSYVTHDVGLGLTLEGPECDPPTEVFLVPMSGSRIISQHKQNLRHRLKGSVLPPPTPTPHTQRGLQYLNLALLVPIVDWGRLEAAVNENVPSLLL